MIREYEVAILLCTELPGMNQELTRFGGTMNVYKAVQCFADYTIGLVKEQKLNMVKNCFSLAEKMMCEGSGKVKTAVENVYMYSIGMLIDRLPSSGKDVKEMISPSLLEVYKRQIISSGI